VTERHPAAHCSFGRLAPGEVPLCSLGRSVPKKDFPEGTLGAAADDRLFTVGRADAVLLVRSSGLKRAI